MHLTNPYLRLMRLQAPTGIWLLLWPCWWALALAGERAWQFYALFAAGAVLMRGAGCIINDICDREFDKQVERTKTRPLASGEVSVAQAMGLLLVLLLLSAGIALLLGEDVVIWAFLSLPLVITYPLMKRITWWPQLFLGFTFNWGALLGWVAVRDTLEMPALLLYIAGVFWTLGYDTIYAHQDKQDDEKIGVKSTARRLGKASKTFISCCYGIFFLLVLLAIMPRGELSWLVLTIAIGWVFATFRSIDLDSAPECKKTFSTNTIIGGLVFVCILLNK